METAESVISDILSELTINAAEQSIQSVDFQTAVRYSNRFMAELDAMGTKLGWTDINNPSDPITIPAGAINGLIYNVALNLATTYDIMVGPELAMKARASLNVMNVIGNPPPKSHYPSNMPIGSGDKQNTFNNFNFYDGCCEDDPVSCGTE